MTVLPKIPSGNEFSEHESNPIPQPLYTHLSGSALLANLKPPNKESFKVRSKFKSHNNASNL